MKWILSAVIDADDLSQAMERAASLPGDFRAQEPLSEWLKSYELASVIPHRGGLQPTGVRVVNNG